MGKWEGKIGILMEGWGRGSCWGVHLGALWCGYKEGVERCKGLTGHADPGGLAETPFALLPIPLLNSLPAGWETWGFWCFFKWLTPRCSFPCESIGAPDYCQSLEHIQKITLLCMNQPNAGNAVVHPGPLSWPSSATPGGCGAGLRARDSHPIFLLRIFATKLLL